VTGGFDSTLKGLLWLSGIPALVEAALLLDQVAPTGLGLVLTAQLVLITPHQALSVVS